MSDPGQPTINIVTQASAFGAPFWSVVGALITAVVGGAFLAWNESKRRAHDVRMALSAYERDVCANLLVAVDRLTQADLPDSLTGADRFRSQIEEIRERFTRFELDVCLEAAVAGRDFYRSMNWVLGIKLQRRFPKLKATPDSTPDSPNLFAQASLTEAQEWFSYNRQKFRNTARVSAGLVPITLKGAIPSEPPKGLTIVFPD